MKIKVSKNIYSGYEKYTTWAKSIMVDFDLHIFENGYMAYCKYIINNLTYRWNSLRKMWKMSKGYLINKISSYDTIWQVARDFWIDMPYKTHTFISK